MNALTSWLGELPPSVFSIWLALLPAVFFAFVVETVVGFGATVVAVSIGSFFVDITELMPIFVPLNLVLSAYLTLRYLGDVAFKQLFRIVLPAMFVGLPFGIYAFQAFPSGILQQIFGLFVILLVVMEFYRRFRPAAPPAEAPAAPSAARTLPPHPARRSIWTTFLARSRGLLRFNGQGPGARPTEPTPGPLAEAAQAADTPPLSPADLPAASSAPHDTPQAPPRERVSPFQWFLLVLGGVVHGAFNSGGPMVVVVMGKHLDTKEAFRATLSALWFILSAVIVVNYFISGQADGGSLVLSASLIPGLLGGLLLGEYLHAKVSLGVFRDAVNTMLLLAGIFLILQPG